MSVILLLHSVLYSYDGKIEHYHIKYKDNEYTIDDEETFENLTQMVEHYQKDSDGLVTRLKVPVEKKSGKVEYSVDSEDFKKSKSGGSGCLGTNGYCTCTKYLRSNFHDFCEPAHAMFLMCIAITACISTTERDKLELLCL